MSENTVSAGQVVIPGVGGGAASIGDPMSGGIAASNIGDPDNPASARGYIGEQAASGTTSDALEDQSHAIAARHFGEATSSGLAAPIEGTPEEYSFRDQASVANASVIGDPDNPANARGYVGDQAGAPTADALEDQSHAIAARQYGEATSSGLAAPIEGTPEEFSFRDQAASTNASITADPDNPAFARGFIGDQSDAFLSEGEVSRYSADPNLSSGQAVDEGQLQSGNASDAIPDDDDIVSVHREPDQPA